MIGRIVRKKNNNDRCGIILPIECKDDNEI